MQTLFQSGKSKYAFSLPFLLATLNFAEINKLIQRNAQKSYETAMLLTEDKLYARTVIKNKIETKLFFLINNKFY